MKRSFYLITLALVLIATGAGAQVSPASVANPALRQELLERLKRDQAIRNEWIKIGFDKADSTFIARIEKIDADNTERMKQIVKQYGWPGPELIGKDGAEAAFLLVQHADADHAFQKEMLPLVRDAYLAKKLAGQDYALLLDRVLVREGKRQVFGTQTKPSHEWKRSEEPEFAPIEDEANVDKRRAEVGLPPLAEYLVMLKQIYFPKGK